MSPKHSSLNDLKLSSLYMQKNNYVYYFRKYLTPSGSLLSHGIVLSISDHSLSTHTYGNTPTQETLLATKVLDGAIVLGLNYTTGGKVTHYLLKVS